MSQEKKQITGAIQSPLLTAALAGIGVRHGFSTRPGGASTVYNRDGLGERNMGLTASDDPEAVHANRRGLVEEVFGKALQLVTLHQVHSSDVVRVTQENASQVRDADGALTATSGLVLGIQTADCVPVLVADQRLGTVAAFHAGWRGTVRRIVEQGTGQMLRESGGRAEDLVAAVGPSIRGCCYCVGDEVEQRFTSEFEDAASLFRRGNRHGEQEADGPGKSELKTSTQADQLFVDLQEANRRQLRAAGVAAKAIDVLKYCTHCRTDLFFSYRAEGGFTGRMMSVIGRDA